MSTPGKRPAETLSSGSATKKAARGETPTPSKPYKGLRHFSMMVCKKVEEKGTTTYNQVADELVAHVVQSEAAQAVSGSTKKGFDEKNIRRRVYDALNVLMAMDIITKDKKKCITWKGLPSTAHQDLDLLERERNHTQAVVYQKRQALRELLVQQVCFRNLIEHNEKLEQEQAAAAATKQPAAKKGDQASPPSNKQHKIPLPFIIVNTHQSAVIQCNMSRDLTDVMFDFSQPFEINDDNTILKRLGMDKTTLPVLREMLPQDIFQYCQEHNLLDSMVVSDAEFGTGPGAASTS